MKLAQVVKILDLQPIDGADRIEVATVLGYKVVTQKGLYEVGDLAIYIVPDTEVPKQPWSEFLFKGDQADKDRIRLKVAKLRGQVSQGLLVPFQDESLVDLVACDLKEGDEMTDYLDVTKYEKPIPACLSGEVFGYMPGFLHKTDEDNLRGNPRCLEELRGRECYITQKVDGTSGTFFWDANKAEFGVCSRQLHLKPSDENTFWRIARSYDLENRLKDYCKGGHSLAIQGEVYGEGIQKNILGMKGQHLQLFDVWSIDRHQHGDYHGLELACLTLGIPSVKTVWKGKFDFTLDQLIDMANEQKYPNGRGAEGIVIRPIENIHSDVLGTRLSVKVISEKFALKHGE